MSESLAQAIERTSHRDVSMKEIENRLENQEEQRRTFEQIDADFRPTPLCSLARMVRLDILTVLRRQHPNITCDELSQCLDEECVLEHMQTLPTSLHRLDVRHRIFADVIAEAVSAVQLEAIAQLNEGLHQKYDVPMNAGITLGNDAFNNMNVEKRFLDVAAEFKVGVHTVSDEQLCPASRKELQHRSNRLELKMKTTYDLDELSLQEFVENTGLLQCEPDLSSLVATRLAMRSLCLQLDFQRLSAAWEKCAKNNSSILPEISRYYIAQLLGRFSISSAVDDGK